MVTTAVRWLRSRTLLSSSPMVTVSTTVCVAPRMLIGSVVASVTSATAEAGPADLHQRRIGGHACPPRSPAAGSSSMSGTTGTVRAAEASNVNDRVAGVTCSTLMPVGTDTSPGRM